MSTHGGWGYEWECSPETCTEPQHSEYRVENQPKEGRDMPRIAPFGPRKWYFHFSDWDEPVPQRTLAELGLDLRYALPKPDWPRVDSGRVVIDPTSYPWQRAIGGELTVEKVWGATPAFRENYPTPLAMLNALLHPKGPPALSEAGS